MNWNSLVRSYTVTVTTHKAVIGSVRSVVDAGGDTVSYEYNSVDSDGLFARRM